MPNWCQNVAKFDAKDDVLEFFQEHDGKQIENLMSQYVPRPEDTDWYEWNLANWGTKWDIDVDVEMHGSEVRLYFNSAWSPPVEFFEKFENVQGVGPVELYFFEPGMGFCGEWNSDFGDETCEIDLSDLDSIPPNVREVFAQDIEFCFGEE